MNTHLTDMEELLGLIVQVPIRDYMREAMGCYMAGAYRGCIVLSCIALFDDLYDKLEELSKINSDAKDIFLAAKSKKEDQSVYETYLLDQLKSKKIIQGLTAEILESIKDRRNKAAHPSGHSPSAEEARYVFSEVIKLVLSKKKMMTTQAVDSIINRLSSNNYFPSSYIDEIESIVSEEINEINPDAYSCLTSKLADIVINDSPEEKVNNARSFINGLARLDNEVLNDALIKHYFNKIIIEDQYDKIISIATANPKILLKLTNAAIKRFRNAFIERAKEVTRKKVASTKLSHPSSLIKKMISKCSSKETIKLLGAAIDVYMDNFTFDCNIYGFIFKNRTLKNTYLELILNKAGSSTFDIANSFAKSIGDVDSELAKKLNAKDALNLVINMHNAGHGGAWHVISHMKDIPKIKTKAKNYISDNPSKAQEMFDEKVRGSMDIPEFEDKYLD
jgi:hypothetical protein